MSNGSEHSASPFHAGEQAIQQRMGVRDKMERFGNKVIRDHLPEQHQQFYQRLPFVFVGHADKAGWPWASILYNHPGFISAIDAKTQQIDALPVAGDPLASSLQIGVRLGLLGIELTTRRRNRMSAHVIATHADGFQLGVDQTFGNCPQYIQSRQLHRANPASAPRASTEKITRLDSRASSLIQGSDTFFVASALDDGSGAVSQGADVSHRGGRQGFVRVDNETTLTIPDFSGNNHFNTLGNFVENPRAGLLFVDFEQGHLLTLTGRVEIFWDSPETKHFAGAQRLWRFHIDHGFWLNHSLPLRWTLEAYSPADQGVRLLDPLIRTP